MSEQEVGTGGGDGSPSPGPAYELTRGETDGTGGTGTSSAHSSRYQNLQGAPSNDYSEVTDGVEFNPAGDSGGVGGGGAGGLRSPGAESVGGGSMAPDKLAGGIGARLPSDSSDTVHQMHVALLYLLSNPDEFSRAVEYSVGGFNMEDWDATFNDAASAITEITGTGGKAESNTPRPLPYAVFASDAEVVLPQAHTANQLFGLERESGIELEAAAGIPALSQLFLRWLALMPEGDHMNVIDPPGLTVMRISGGRFRCTAAHRAVWTWNSEFPPELFGPPEGSEPHPMDDLHMGDLVCMNIIDVFETDTDGRLLSYCPTFDNRSIRKTLKRAEQLRKGASNVKAVAKTIAASQTAAHVNSAAVLVSKFTLKAATYAKDRTVAKIDDEMNKQKALPAVEE